MKKQKIVAGDRLPSKKMSLNHQAKYIRLMGELLDHGFSIQEATEILLKITPVPHIYLQQGHRLLQEGRSFMRFYKHWVLLKTSLCKSS